MISAYAAAQKKKVRITLELEVYEDFDPHQINYEKLFDLEPAEKLNSYVEVFDENRW